MARKESAQKQIRRAHAALVAELVPAISAARASLKTPIPDVLWGALCLAKCGTEKIEEANAGALGGLLALVKGYAAGDVSGIYNVIGHVRWVLLVSGILTLLEKEEADAYGRVMAALKRHGLVGPTMHFSRERIPTKTGGSTVGDFLPYSETVMFTGAADDPREMSPFAIKAVLDKAQAFAADPFLGNRRGESKKRRVEDRELLIAYRAARWKIETEMTGAQLRGESVTARAHAMVGDHYGHTSETVASYLQDARRRVQSPTRKGLEQLGGANAWKMTLGAPRPSNRGGFKK